MGYRDDPGEGGNLRLYPGAKYSLMINAHRQTSQSDADAIASAVASAGVSIIDGGVVRYAYYLYFRFAVQTEMDAYTLTSALSSLGYSVYPTDIKVTDTGPLNQAIADIGGAINDALSDLPDSLTPALPVGLLILAGVALVAISLRR